MDKSNTLQFFVLPTDLSACGFGVRAERGGDYTFLEGLYVAVRWPELSQCDWTDGAKLAFLHEQFALQNRHYATHYADTEFLILEKDGQPVGRLYLLRGAKDYRIVDISLLPGIRNGGVGASLLKGVLAEAAQAQCTVSIHVEKFNPAQTLYRRLGFKEIGESGPYWRMQWAAAPQDLPCPPHK